uniref:Amino acid transporter transmembrane domain-containing protein n=1 Tax=Cucumis melo TaxID=3656 RepID=A0A9I9CCA3_CUCME
MDNNVVHTMTNGGDARGGTREEVRQVPRVRAARFRGEDESMGNSLKKIHDLACHDCKPIKITYFIMIFASVHFFLSHLPSFNSITLVSLAAA